MPMTMIITKEGKYCRFCDQALTLAEFYNKASTKDKKQCYCKLCQHQIVAKWKREHRR